MSVILNVAFVGLLVLVTAGSASRSASLVAWLVNTQFSDQDKVKDTSQLINGMFNVLQKFLKCSNGTKNSTFFFFYIIISQFSCNACVIIKTL